MDSRHTGSDELVYIRTNKVSITIKGKAAHPNFQGVEYTNQVSPFQVFCDEDFDISLKNSTVDRKSYNNGEYTGIYTIPPLFYEQQRYELIIEAEGNHAIQFWHENLNIRDKITQVGRSGHILSGVINFGNEIGFSDLVIQVDGKNYLRLVVKVFPSKIDYETDYQEIIDDVTRELYSLVFDFLRKTYLGFQQNSDTVATPVEFFSVLQKIYSDFLRAADLILAQPHHILQKTQEVLPAHKIKRIDSQGRRWIEKHPNHALKSRDRISVDRALAVKKQVTYDTRENRLTKYILISTANKLASFKKSYKNLARQEDYKIIEKIDEMIRDLNRRASTSFLSEVGAYVASSGMSLVFSMAPGYRDLYKYYLMLLHGLSITGDMFNISLKELALLYEYWCFIKLNSLMKDRYELVSQDIIRIHGNGLYVSLVKGCGSRVKYRNPANGETITLSYNPKITDLPTGTQRPDNVLKLTKQGSKVDYEYVFDAKYRINPALPGTDYYASISHLPGPEVSDINTMHRYRDAIVYQKGASLSERRMFGAYVLFPYANESEYANHRFYKSIEKVNIGGLPFLPSATSLVTEILDALINDSPDSAFERTTLPRGIEEKLSHVDWSRRDVLIGSLQQRSQLDLYYENKFYDISASYIPADSMPIHYVALYQPKSVFGSQGGVRLYGEVISCDLINNPNIPGAFYYRLKVKAWETLPQPIAAKEMSLHHLFTNLFLLKHSTEVPELTLQNENEYRLFNELKRAFHQIDVVNRESAPGFKFKGSMVVFENGKINVYHNGTIIDQYPVDLFSRKPGAVFRKLLAHVQSI